MCHLIFLYQIACSGKQCYLSPGFNVQRGQIFSAFATVYMNELNFDAYTILCQYSNHIKFSFRVLKIKVNLVKSTFSDCQILEVTLIV